MPDFNEPKYASYVQLCRELKLEREWRLGDWQLTFLGSEYGWPEPRLITEQWRPLTPRSLAGIGDLVWLPTLADWLEMLEMLGYPDVAVGEFGWPSWRAFLVLPSMNGWEVEDQRGIQDAPTREEAAARLWMTVKP